MTLPCDNRLADRRGTVLFWKGKFEATTNDKEESNEAYHLSEFLNAGKYKQNILEAWGKMICLRGSLAIADQEL